MDPTRCSGAVGDAGTVPAVGAINAAGGVMGHQFAWKNVDTRGDPADAVPAANQLLASTSGLVLTEGPTSDEASATVPIFNRAGVPMNIGSGASVFDKSPYAYLWRNTPPDAGDGAAIAYYARNVKHYTTAAAVFGNDISSQGAEPSVMSTFTGLGGKIVATENIALDSTSYETEVAKVIAAHPQVIFTEADPQTSATFFQDLANAGGLRPFIGTDGTNGAQWANAVSKAVGASNFKRYYNIVQFGAPPSRRGESVQRCPREIHKRRAKAGEAVGQQSICPERMGLHQFDRAGDVGGSQRQSACVQSIYRARDRSELRCRRGSGLCGGQESARGG